MTRFRLQLSILLVAFAVCGAARASIYGYLENGRNHILYSDTAPADSRYRLYKKDRPGKFSERFSETVRFAGVMRSRYRSHVLAAARETSVDAALIHAVISVESGYNPSARSRAGAVGLMQLMPHTAKRYGVTNRLDPAQNIQGGARYLRDLKLMFGNQLHLVLAAYNAGENAVKKYGRRIPPYQETVAYVPKVMSHYRKYRAAAPAPLGG